MHDIIDPDTGVTLGTSSVPVVAGTYRDSAKAQAERLLEAVAGGKTANIPDLIANTSLFDVTVRQLLLDSPDEFLTKAYIPALETKKNALIVELELDATPVETQIAILQATKLAEVTPAELNKDNLEPAPVGS